MTGMQFADILRDACTLSGAAPEYDWVRAWTVARGVPLGIAAAEAADAAGTEGLLALWLRALAGAFCGRYTADAAEFACAADEAARALFPNGAERFLSAVRNARDAGSFSAWSAAACADALPEAKMWKTDERVFLPWLCAMRARYTQE